MPRTLSPLALALFFLAALPGPGARAQGKDTATLEHYTLTMDKLMRFSKVADDLGAFAKAHPEVKDKLTTDADQHEDLDAITRRISAMPEVVAIMNKDGLPPREFVLVEMAYLQASMAFAMKPADMPDARYCAETHLNPANLAFIRDHQTELQAMQSKLGGS